MMNPIPQNAAVRLITDAQWQELWLKLRIYTWRKYRWLHELTGVDLDDLAQQAIFDTYSGKRRWPPIDSKTGRERWDVSIFWFLCQTVRSLASHAAKTPTPIDIDRLDPSSEAAEFEPAFAGPSPPFLVRANDIQRAAEYNDLTKRMLQLVSSDSEVKRIIELWRACPDLKPREVACELQLTMPEMRSAQKRLRRLLDGLRRTAK